MKVVPLGNSIAQVEKLSSKFIAYLFPLGKEDEVESLLMQVKEASPKADHYPYAYRFEGISKSNDDGEPSGGAGKPMLTLLENKGIDRCLIAVARYFGGSKLGLPRLRRTFVEAASLAIENASLGEVLILDSYKLKLTYHDYEEVRRYASRLGFGLTDVIFGEFVETKILSEQCTIEDIGKLISNQSGITYLKKEEFIKEI